MIYKLFVGGTQVYITLHQLQYPYKLLALSLSHHYYYPSWLKVRNGRIIGPDYSDEHEIESLFSNCHTLNSILMHYFRKF